MALKSQIPPLYELRGCFFFIECFLVLYGKCIANLYHISCKHQQGYTQKTDPKPLHWRRMTGPRFLLWRKSHKMKRVGPGLLLWRKSQKMKRVGTKPLHWRRMMGPGLVLWRKSQKMRRVGPKHLIWKTRMTSLMKCQPCLHLGHLL